MSAESLLALAALAGRMVVAAAATDTWETAERGFVRLLGRGDPKQTQIAEQRMEETRKQLTAGAGTDTEQTRTALAERWAGRLADLLEENPDVEADLRALVQRIQATLPAGMVSASDRAVADGELDVGTADGRPGAAVPYGNMAPPNPTLEGSVTG